MRVPFSTSLNDSLIKQLKITAIKLDISVNTLLETIITDWLYTTGHIKDMEDKH